VTRRLAPFAVVATLLLAVAAASGHGPGPPASLCPGSNNVVSRGDWQIVAKPKELERVVTHAVGGVDGRTVLASDGRIVMRSTDGGCTWKQVFSIETAQLPGDSAETPHVAQLSYPNPASPRATMVLDGIGQSLGSRLMVSAKNGDEGSWEMASGLPVTGRYRDVVGDGGDGAFVVTGPRDEAAAADPGATGELWYGKGTTFERVSGGRPIVSLAVGDLNRLYAVRSNHDVEVSHDGGRSWETLAISADSPLNPATVPNDPQGAVTDDNPWRWVAFKHDPESGVSVIAVAASAEGGSKPSRLLVSRDDGKKWTDLPVGGLGPIGGMTFANSPAQLILASGSPSEAQRGPGLVVYDIALQQFRDVDDLELASLYEPRLYPLSAASRGHPGLFGVQLRRHRAALYEEPDVIARYIPPDPPPPQFLRARPCAERIDAELQEGVDTGGGGRRASAPEPQLPQLGRERRAGDPDRPLKPGETHAEPGVVDVRLEPGKPERLPLSVKLGAQPSPLDLAFVIDSSESMDPGMDGVMCSVERTARRLREKGVDAQFAIASYNDRIEYRYRRILDFTPSPERIMKTVKTFNTLEGTEEPIRSGLYQLATGTGLATKEQQDDDAPPTAPRTVPVTVPPGQNVSFREGTTRIAMVVGDEPYEEFTDDEPGLNSVIDALKAKRIKTFGIQLMHPVLTGVSGDEGLNQPRPLVLRQQLQTFARETGGLAPRGGVDCDGGGEPDLREGEPLVCPIDVLGMRDSVVDTILALLFAEEERQPTEIFVDSAAGLDIRVEDGRAENVNVKKASALAGTAVLSCTAAQAGRRYPVSFGVRVGQRKVASIPGVVACGKMAALAPSRETPNQAAPAQERPAPGDPSPQPAPGGNSAPSPAPTPTPASQPTPQAAAVVTPPPPPPSPAPINSPSPASSASAAPSAASSPAASAAVAPGQGGMAFQEDRSPGPQVALADSDRARSTGGASTEHAMVAARPLRARDRSFIPAPAAITLGAGVCGAAGWLVLAGSRRRRDERVVRAR
jgi:hypothetical protein